MEPIEINLLTVKAEANYGVDPTPTLAANLIPVMKEGFGYEVQTSRVERRLFEGTPEKLPGFNALPNVTLKFRYELRGNRTDGATPDITAGAVGQAIEIDAILQAANLTPAYTAETTGGARDGFVIYKPSYPTTTVGASITCWWYTALKLHKLTGGKAEISFVMEAGKPAYMDVTVRGKYTAVADNTFSTSGAAWADLKPPLVAGNTLEIGNQTTSVTAMCRLDLGNQIGMRRSIVDTQGIAGFFIGGFEPKCTVDPESVAEASNPIWADMIASNVWAGVLLVGSVSGNKMQFDWNAETTKVTYGDREKSRIQTIEADLVRSSLGTTASSLFNLKFF